MDFDWKKALPFIGALATGGVPALVVTAAAAIGEALGTTVDPTEAGVDAALRAATPEQLVALKAVDANLKIRLRELDTEDKKIDASVISTFISDIKDARAHNANTYGVLVMGFLINLSSYLVVGGVLWGCFWLLSNPKGLGIDPGIAAMLGGIVGAAVQWIMANASQANSFFFGSSPQSRQATTDLAQATTAAITKGVSK